MPCNKKKIKEVFILLNGKEGFNMWVPDRLLRSGDICMICILEA